MAEATPNVTVVGTGFGGLEAAFYLRKRLGRRVQITIVSESSTFLFKPNTIYIPFGKPPEAFVFQLEPAFAKRQILFLKGHVDKIDPAHKTLSMNGNGGAAKQLTYDYLVLATGATLLGIFREEIPAPQYARVPAFLAGVAVFGVVIQLRWRM